MARTVVRRDRRSTSKGSRADARRAVPVADRPGHPLARSRIGRKGVGLAQVVQLKAMLDVSQPSVRLVEVGGVGRLDVAALAEAMETLEGIRRPQRRVRPAVDQLEQLDGELDVADAADASLELVVPADECLCPGLHHPDLPHRVGAERVGIHEWRCGGEERLAEVGVACHRPCLHQRLEFPGLGPALPVRPVRVQGPRQRAGSPLRPEVGIDPEGDAVAGAFGHRLDESRGRRRSRLLVSIVDEDEVDVRGVVELAPAPLAEGDHRHGGLRLGRCQGDPGCRIGEVAQRQPDLGHRQPRGEVGSGDPDQVLGHTSVQVPGVQGRRRKRAGGEERCGVSANGDQERAECSARPAHRHEGVGGPRRGQRRGGGQDRDDSGGGDVRLRSGPQRPPGGLGEGGEWIVGHEKRVFGVRNSTFDRRCQDPRVMRLTSAFCPTLAP